MVEKENFVFDKRFIRFGNEDLFIGTIKFQSKPITQIQIILKHPLNIFIGTFEVVSKYSAEYNDTYKGIGKILLYKSLLELMKHGKITSNSIVTLAAVAGNKNPLCNQHFIKTPKTEEEINTYLTKYRKESELSKSIEEKIKEYCKIENNLKLVAYYKSLGFRIDDTQNNENILYTHMIAQVDNLLEKLTLLGVTGKKSKNSKRSSKRSNKRSSKRSNKRSSKRSSKIR